MTQKHIHRIKEIRAPAFLRAFFILNLVVIMEKLTLNLTLNPFENVDH